MTTGQAWAVMARLPAETAVAVGRALDMGAALEAQRMLAVALGDGREAMAVVAALVEWRMTGHANPRG